MIVRGASVVMSNTAARNLLGIGIEDVDVRQVLPHPALIERLVRGQLTGPEEIEAAGFGGSRRHWLARIAPLGDGAILVRLIDRSEARAAEQMRVDFVANASHELRTPLATLIGYTETLREHTGEPRRGYAGPLPVDRPRRGAADAAGRRRPDLAVADRGGEVHDSDRGGGRRAVDRSRGRKCQAHGRRAPMQRS